MSSLLCRLRRAAPALGAAALLCLPTGCGLWPELPPASASPEQGPQPLTAPGSKVQGQVVQPVDIKPYLHPKGKYLGVALPGVVESPAPLADFSAQIGRNPDLVEFYSAWGDTFETATVESNWKKGALSNIALEPNKPGEVADIIAGKADDYIRQYASQVHQLNLPVAISFGHEMNGDWRPWGRTDITPAQFVAAWKHIHDTFLAAGATSVIWVWSPNQTTIIGPPNPLAAYWPGDAYVDWIGVIGYYDQDNRRTFDSLFGSTFEEIRRFSQKPFLISEIAAGPGTRKAAEISDLFASIARHDDVIGFNWFNFYKQGVKDETDWKVDSSPQALAAFRSNAARPEFGFDVNHP